MQVSLLNLERNASNIIKALSDKDR